MSYNMREKIGRSDFGGVAVTDILPLISVAYGKLQLSFDLPGDINWLANGGSPVKSRQANPFGGTGSNEQSINHKRC